MTLTIDTSNADLMMISLELAEKKYLKKIKSTKQQSEKLLISIESLLEKYNFSFKDLKKIKVESEGNSFTSLRIGVLTANALAYALKIPVEALNNNPNLKFPGGYTVAPKYQSEPNIGKAKQSAC